MEVSCGVLFLVTHLVPYPPIRGVELRIYRLLKWLSAEGFRVILILSADSLDAHTLSELQKVTHGVYWTKPALGTRVASRFPHLRRWLWEPLKQLLAVFPRWYPRDKAFRQKTALPQRVLNTAQGCLSKSLSDNPAKRGLCSEKLISLVGRLAQQYRPQAVIAEYIYLTRVFENIPIGTLKIVDTIDVFSRKAEQVLVFGIVDPFACSEDEERQYLLQADVILAIQSKEVALLKALVPERQVLLAGMDLDVVDALPSGEEALHSIAVVASDNALNVHGLRAFLAECWPAIKTACPDVSLHVVGRVGEMCRIDDSSIRYSGWIDDLDQVYREANVIINPTVAGTGLKIKSVQALAHGKPLVAWPNGVEGMEYEGEAPFVECRSWEEFAEAVIRLLRSDNDRGSMAARARAYAQSEFSAHKVYASLRDRLAETVPPQRKQSISTKERRAAIRASE